MRAGVRLPKRKRLIVRYSVLSLGLLAAATLLLYQLRPEPEPYVAGDRVEGVIDSLGRELPQDYPRITFQDVAAERGIDFQHFWGRRSTQLPEDMGSGAAWGDYDNDGDLDLYLCNIAAPLTATPQELASSPASSRLYRNEGNGTFADVTSAAGVEFRGLGMAAAWGDYDGDGHLDLVITGFGRNRLFHNRGDGSFEDSSEVTGIGGEEGFWSGASWGDYDNDGDLDLYVCGYVRYQFEAGDRGKTTRQYSGIVPYTLNPSSYDPERNLLFENLGRGSFREVAGKLGVDNLRGRSLAASWTDFDRDGWLDLYIANDISDNVMFRNLGKGRFQDVSHPAFVADYRGAMGLAVGDWDGDQDLDVFVTHWIAQENALLNNLLFAFGSTERRENLLFMDIADQVGLGQIALDYIGWGASFFDYDNDARPDLLAVNGSTFQDEQDPSLLKPMRPLLFWNAGEDEGFFEVGGVSGSVFQEARVGRGAAFADFDRDGDVDVVIVNHSGKAQLLENRGDNRPGWFTVQVRASGMNRFGLGAWVELTAGGRTQLQQLGSQPSYLSQNALEAYFGLGAAAQVDRLTVILPDGRRRVLENLPANQLVAVEIP